MPSPPARPSPVHLVGSSRTSRAPRRARPATGRSVRGAHSGSIPSDICIKKEQDLLPQTPLFFYGDPGGNRTPDLMLRRHLLYPTELRDREPLQKPRNRPPFKRKVVPAGGISVN